jgi:hypothetical protein
MATSCDKGCGAGPLWLARVLKAAKTFVLASMSMLGVGMTISDARANQVSLLVLKGQRQAVWGTLCESPFCSEAICFDIKSRAGTPAHAKIAVEASLHKTVNTEATGHFCSDSKYLSYFMTMTVYVEATDEDVYATYQQSGH